MNETLINAGDRVLIVDDWIETGGQVKGIIKLLEKQGAEIIGISALGFNQTKRTKSISDSYFVKGISTSMLFNQKVCYLIKKDINNYIS